MAELAPDGPRWGASPDGALRSHEFLGLLLVAAVLVDGALVAASLTLQGSRGPFLSLDRTLFIALLIFGCLRSVRQGLVSLLYRGDVAVGLALLVLWMAVGALRADLAQSGVWLRSYLVEAGRWVAIGGMTTTCLAARRRPGPGRVHGAAAPAAAATALLWAGLGWMYVNGLGAVRTDLFYVVTYGTEQYQVLGDTLAMGVAAVMALQWHAMVDGPRSRTWLPAAYVVLVVAQGIAVVVLLQLFGSNKAPLLVVMSMGVALWTSVPPRRTAARRWYLAALLVLVAAIALALARIELPRIRLFDFGAEGGVLGGTSLRSRTEFLREAWLPHLSDQPLIGNPNLGVLRGDYLHSSILSVQASLGVVGTLLLGGVLLTGWLRVRTRPEYILVRLVAGPVVVVSVVGTFFMWGPLWLLLGALAAVPRAWDAGPDPAAPDPLPTDGADGGPHGAGDRAPVPPRHPC
jgi:hypothetical protein